MSGDHNADINKGNCNDLIEEDYMGTQSNFGTNIQKAENVFIEREENSDISNSNNPKSSSSKIANKINSPIPVNQGMESITKILIMFPYHGHTDSEEIFWELIKNCRRYSIYDPIVVVNRDTIERGQADQFIEQNKIAQQYGKLPSVETLQVWSVDTCQMWLHGWGKIIDDNEVLPEGKKIERIIQLPGDLKSISNREEFYKKLEDFCIADCDITKKRCYDIVVGDFKTREFVGKSLIDSYGTFPLLANWFPEISKEIFLLPLYKPRSEFLNLRVDTLRELLKNHRPFSYEQTLNMLINSWDSHKKEWKYKIKCFNLGYIQDDSGHRLYQGCLDQVERTERMLKCIWRETNAPNTQNEQEFKKFMDNYDFLCQRSQAICETARITIRSLLGLGLVN